MTDLAALPLSRKQVGSIVEADARINIWQGSVRSGKTIASLLRWLAYVADPPAGGGELAMCGKTRETVARNLFAPLQDPRLFGELAHQVAYTPGAPTATILGRTVHVLGANDAKAEPKVRGMTLGGAYVDEATLVPQDFWKQLLARLSVPRARLFATTNPDNPAHWLRKDFLLRADTLDLRSWHFTLDDNPALDPTYVANLKREYVGLWYRRFILGAWVQAEGAVYDQFDPERHVVTDLPHVVRWLSLGVDYGTANPFAALLLGLGEDGRLYLVAEYRHDSRAARRQKTDAEYSADLRTFLANVRRPGEDYRGVTPEWICVDPSAASFITQLRHDAVPGVMGANNSVLDGIRTFSSLLAADLLKIHESCTGLLDELPGYSWDDTAAEQGEDKPIKGDDHSLDGARYAIKTTEPLWRPELHLGQEAA